MNATVLNLLAFHLVWLATVWGAATGNAMLGLAAFFVFAVWQLRESHCRRHELVLMAAVVPLGWLVDSGYVVFGLLTFAEPLPGPPFAPWWIALLWANFTLVINHGIAALASRPWLGAGLGAIGGPLAYLSAAALGAVEFTVPRPVALAVLAAVWAAAVPALFALDRRLKGITDKKAKAV